MRKTTMRLAFEAAARANPEHPVTDHIMSSRAGIFRPKRRVRR